MYWRLQNGIRSYDRSSNSIITPTATPRIKTLKDDVRRLLHEISEDLCQAIGESPAVGSKLAELQAAGYSLNLLLDCRELEDGEEADAELVADALSSAAAPQNKSGSTRDGERPSDEELAKTKTRDGSGADHNLSFRINAEDLAILRSLGIDPTRPARGKNPRRGAAKVPDAEDLGDEPSDGSSKGASSSATSDA